MGVNSLPKTVTRQRRDCDLNPRPSVPESSTLTTRLTSHPTEPSTLPQSADRNTSLSFSGTAYVTRISDYCLNIFDTERLALYEFLDTRTVKTSISPAL